MPSYHFVTPAMGEKLKDTRLSLGLSQEQLADDEISTGTISNLERGSRKVSSAKLKHLCKKLSLDFQTLLELEEEPEELDEETFELELLMIENELEIRPEDAWKRLQQLDPDHPWVCYLKGKYYANKRQWLRSEDYLRKAMEKAYLMKNENTKNLLSFIYYELSRNAYYQSNFTGALRYIETGIKVYQKHEDKRYIFYYLLTSQIIYLKRLNRSLEAFKRLEDAKTLMRKIENTTIILSLIDLEAGLLNDLGYYMEAIEKAKYGLEFAKLERRFERAFELYCTLGTSWMFLQSWAKAEKCFVEALKAKETARKDLLVLPYKKLGEMYHKIEDYEKAIKHLNKAKMLASRYEDRVSFCEINILLGEVYQKQGLSRNALIFYNEAIKISNRFQLKNQQMQAVNQYINCAKTCQQNRQEIIETLMNSLLECDSKEVDTMYTYQLLDTDPPSV